VICAGHFTIPAEHPCLPGHFPGRPIVPGVVVLDHALALALAQLPGRALAALLHAKFSAPVRPGDAVDVAYDLAQDRLGFTCRVAGAVAVRGAARLR
jgi:3-hydroxymyristoyl/3-hydroxydecanoyl-(acyl carrier protein) dehydratase